jgi:hypothetical protein
MAIRTIYTCDKCGEEHDTSNNFWNVGVMAHSMNYSPSDKTFVKDKSMQVCRPCLESFGIYVTTKVNMPAPPAPPAVEELIRDLITRCTD